MIFLTGDVHHMGPRMGDQKRLTGGRTEVRIAEEYLALCNTYQVCPTLFFTGLAVKREADFIRTLLERYQFELGGHTYSANHHRWLLGLSRRAFGLANGPYWFQKEDVSATVRCIRTELGISIASWRNHAYRMDRNTYKIAAAFGITRVSNRVTGIDGTMQQVEDILEVPINTLPDHESLGHDCHKRLFHSAKGWVNEVLRQIDYQQERNLPSVILAHPLCMFVEDKFVAFERLCAAIGNHGKPMRECVPAGVRADSGVCV
jgi:hypothetical protein